MVTAKRERRRIVSDISYSVSFAFKKPTSEETFKKSRLYKQIIKFIEDNGLILYSEDYNQNYFPEDIEYDMEWPDNYSFEFLIKTHANKLKKQFNPNKQVIVRLFEYECDTNRPYIWEHPSLASDESAWMHPDWDEDEEIDWDDLPGFR
jgi:hypothetical protein